MKKLASLIIVCQAAALLHSPSLPAADLSLDYSTYLGGSGSDTGNGIRVGTSGEAYVAGHTVSSDFPIANPYQASNRGSTDVFVSRLSSSGSSLICSTYLGGSSGDEGHGITLGTGGEAYVAGYTVSSDFPTVNPYQASYGGGASDAFVIKLSSSGSSLVYSTYLGGSGNDYGDGGITLGTSGEAYITGTTGSTTFPTANPYQASYGGGTYDAFVSRLSSSGSSLIYSTYLGGSTNDHEDGGITLGTGGEAYVAGLTNSANFPTLNPYQASNSGVYDIFVSNLSSSGSSLVYSTYLGGSGNDYGDGGITLGTGGEAYVAGYTASSIFPTLNPYQASYGGGTYDAFVSRLSSSGSSLIYSTYLGGSSGDWGYGITLGTGGEAYVAGYTDSTNFSTLNPYQASHSGGTYDGFVSSLGSSGSSLIYSTYLGGGSDDYVAEGGIALGTSGETYVAGYTASSNFPTLNPYQTSFGGSQDAFVSKLVFGTTPSPSPTPHRLVLDADDFDGDGTADLGLWRSADGSWRMRDISIVYYGLNGDLPVTGDYNADGIADIAVFRPSAGKWCLRNPLGGSLWNAYFGQSGDVPVPADYDGDFRTDTAVFRPANAGWYVRGMTRFNYGLAGDLPVPGDYNGDGSAEASLYRYFTGGAVWYVRSFTTLYYGQPGDLPVPGDYDGDGTTQFSVFRPSSGRWYVRGEVYVTFGQSGDIPVVFDYDGDGSSDRALYRPSEDRWYIYGTTSVTYGTSGDQPASGTTH